MTATTTTTRPRPRSLPSVTTKLRTEYGNLYVTVCLDDDGLPPYRVRGRLFEVFGSLGKAGSLQHGVTELTCRLVSRTCGAVRRWKKSWTSARESRRCSPRIKYGAGSGPT